MLNEADRTRLRKLCGMLGSAHDGERASAAGFIQKLAEAHKLSIDELMTAGFAQVVPPEKTDREPAYNYSREMAESILRRQGQWGGFSQPHYRRRPDSNPEDNEPVPVLPLGWWEALVGAGKCRNLSRWDREFSRDISERYKHRRELTDNQVRCVAKVLERYHAAR